MAWQIKAWSIDQSVFHMMKWNSLVRKISCFTIKSASHGLANRNIINRSINQSTAIRISGSHLLNWKKFLSTFNDDVFMRIVHVPNDDVCVEASADHKFVVGRPGDTVHASSVKTPLVREFFLRTKNPENITSIPQMDGHSRRTLIISKDQVVSTSYFGTVYTMTFLYASAATR